MLTKESNESLFQDSRLSAARTRSRPRLNQETPVPVTGPDPKADGEFNGFLCFEEAVGISRQKGNLSQIRVVSV